MGAREILFLNESEVAQCGISPSDVVAAVERVFREKTDGNAFTCPGLVVPGVGRGAFHAKVGVNRRLAALKWFGYYPENAEDLLPSFWPLICLNDMRDGMPVAVTDGRAISHIRTAAITAVAAKRIASSNSRCVAFIACGNQAKAHLETLSAVFKIDLVYAYSRRLRTVEQFCEMAGRSGCRAIAAADPKEAVVDADIIVTSVPVRAAPEFLDANWIKPGAFVSMVDLGWSWKRESLSRLDFVLTDDLDQGGGAAGFNFDGQIAVDIPAILAKPPALPPHVRSALIFSGSGLADVAVAELVLRRAKDLGLGKSVTL